ncbi:MAG: pyruvate/2-oxoglutarate dehydrogenase complex dihydrolipoamide dehydrogenase (E3) component [Rhodothermales bacterium]|jgi:pyruvate/2-oxoglutarate dehydrogenase complex dihydrolipoamide dehydrogenase (E3) component
MQEFDHVIIGTGQALGTLLGRLIPTGDSIAVLEGARVGGTCVNYGCTPTKTLVASAKVAHMARRASFYGVEVGEPKIDFGRVRERMNEIRKGSSQGLTDWMERTENVTLIREWGAFEGPRTVRAGDSLIRGKRVYINTGTHPFLPPIPGLKDVPWLDSARLLGLKSLPEHLVIIGGGYVGVELGQVYRRFGSAVTIIQRGTQLMPREDEDVAEAVLEVLRGEGIEVILQAQTSGVSEADGSIRVAITADGVQREITGSHVLLAVGRRPNTSLLKSDAAGIVLTKRGYIAVDDHCRTTADGVFALGDVNGEGAFTHTSVNDAEIVLDLLFGGTRTVSQRIPIYGLFTDPPLGRVGMSEKEALASGRKVLKATRAMSKISRAKEMGETQGFAKLLVDAETDLIIGASILGPGGDEIINMFAAIMHSGIPCKNYREVVLVHPTVSELMPWVLDGLKAVN